MSQHLRPFLLELGGFTTGLFSQGTSSLLGLFLLLNGASIDLKKIGLPLYKGVVLTAMKFLFGLGLGMGVTAVFGMGGVAGITPMALIVALTNSAGGLYLGLARQYGDPTDAGAISVLSLNDGPFFTMIAMGASGMATVPISSLFATVIPLLIGMVWGNIDETFREKSAQAMPIICFFMMIPLGAGMHLGSLWSGGGAGLLLATISALSGLVFYVLYQLCLPPRNRNAMGAAIGTTAANATSIPLVIGELDPQWLPYVADATVQVAVAAIITTFTAPCFTALLDRRMRRKQLGCYSPESSCGN